VSSGNCCVVWKKLAWDGVGVFSGVGSNAASPVAHFPRQCVPAVVNAPAECESVYFVRGTIKGCSDLRLFIIDDLGHTLL
jgi:hypothetical protein